MAITQRATWTDFQRDKKRIHDACLLASSNQLQLKISLATYVYIQMLDWKSVIHECVYQEKSLHLNTYNHILIREYYQHQFTEFSVFCCMPRNIMSHQNLILALCLIVSWFSLVHVMICYLIGTINKHQAITWIYSDLLKVRPQQTNENENTFVMKKYFKTFLIL